MLENTLIYWYIKKKVNFNRIKYIIGYSQKLMLNTKPAHNW